MREKVKKVLAFTPLKEKITESPTSTPLKEKITRSLTSTPLKEKITESLGSITGNEKIIGSLASVPLIAAATMSDSCAGGCPYGLTNDPFPGQCGRYIDSNGDGICDLSQVLSSSSTSSSASQTSTSNTDSGAQSSSTSSDSVNSNQLDSGNSNGSDNASVVTDTGSSGSDGTFLGTDYHVLPLSFLLIGAYMFTHFLFQKGILQAKTHKRLWNLLVTVGYAGVGVTGVLLTLMVNLGIKAYSQGITFWHAETAVLMVMGTLIHLHIYRKPFKRMFKVLFRWESYSNKKPAEIPYSEKKSLQISQKSK